MDIIRVKDDEMALEEIAWKYRIEAFGGDMEKASKLSGFVEQVYELNPGLAALGPLIPIGTELKMPPLTASKQPVLNRLWG